MLAGAAQRRLLRLERRPPAFAHEPRCYRARPAPMRGRCGRAACRRARERLVEAGRKLERLELARIGRVIWLRENSAPSETARRGLRDMVVIEAALSFSRVEAPQSIFKPAETTSRGPTESEREQHSVAGVRMCA